MRPLGREAGLIVQLEVEFGYGGLRYFVGWNLLKSFLALDYGVKSLVDFGSHCILGGLAGSVFRSFRMYEGEAGAH